LNGTASAVPNPGFLVGLFSLGDNAFCANDQNLVVETQFFPPSLFPSPARLHYTFVGFLRDPKIEKKYEKEQTRKKKRM